MKKLYLEGSELEIKLDVIPDLQSKRLPIWLKQKKIHQLDTELKQQPGCVDDDDDELNESQLFV